MCGDDYFISLVIKFVIICYFGKLNGSQLLDKIFEFIYLIDLGYLRVGGIFKVIIVDFELELF